MEIIKATKENLASVIMGKTIQHPWRGQPDIVIAIPYSEWLSFIKKYVDVISNRNPLNYRRMLATDDEAVMIRYFYYEVSWALYSEIALSSNVRKDATLIVPYFDSGESIPIEDIIAQASKMTVEDTTQCDNSLKAATRSYYGIIGATDVSLGTVDTSILSNWNMLAYKLCMYIQSRSSKKVETTKFNIDWRITQNG